MYIKFHIKFKLDFSSIREYPPRNFPICNKLFYHFYSTLAGSSILLYKNNFHHNTDSPFPSSESNDPLDRPQNKPAAARSSSVLLATTGQYISTGFFSHARDGHLFSYLLSSFFRIVVQYERLLTHLYYVKVRLSILGHISASFPISPP